MTTSELYDPGLDFSRAKYRSSFFISLVELDEFNKIKLSKIGRLDQGLNLGRLHNSQAW